MVEQQQPSFSIIIPTYQRPRQLAECLQALTQLDYPRDRFEVIIVDDGSETPLDAVVAPFHDQLPVKVLRQAHAGPAAARNTGAAHAKGQFLAFTDDDCAPDPHWLSALARPFAATPKAIIGGRMINAVQHNLCADASQLLIAYLYAYHGDGPKPGRFFASSNLAVPADRFRALDGFDPSFLLAAGEDRDFCDRWQSAGCEMIYTPEAVVYHTPPLSLWSFWRQHFRYGRGAFYFHQARARRGDGQIRWEPFSFYRRMLQYPFSRVRKPGALVLVPLLILSQVANALGFFWEKMTRKQVRSGWTLRQVLRRATTILREEGLKSLWFKILGETVYRRAVLLERPLDEPLTEGTPGVPLRVGLLAENQVDEYLRFRSEANPSDIHRRLAEGQRCFVVRCNDDLVHASWTTTKRAQIDYLARKISLAPDEIYVYETYTAPAFRGRNIALSRVVWEGQYLRAAGYRRMVSVVMPENTSGMRQTIKAGYHPIGVMGYVKLGPWRWDFCRVKTGARPPGAPSTCRPQTQQRWTSSKILQRTAEVLRDEGIKSLWFKVLGETVYRRVALMERRVDEPIAEMTPSVPLTVNLLTEAEVDEYLAFRPEANSAEIRRRLQSKHWCFVARHEGRMVYVCWAATHRIRIDYLAREIQLATDEVYVYETFIASEFRGRNVAAVPYTQMLRYFRDAGYQRVVTVIVPENTPALRLAQKVGVRQFGIMGYMKFGLWRRDFCQVKDNARPPGAPLDSYGPTYWDRVGRPFKRKPHYLDEFLGTLKRQAHLTLIERWGGIPARGRVLKTDLFEEAIGPDAFLEDLSASGECVIGMDVSAERTLQAKKQSVNEQVHYITADARALPFANSSFTLVVSPSTLDHFPDPHDLGRSLRELARVLTLGGRLIITLDNRQNIFDPLLRLAHRLGWVPYYLGRSYRVDELRKELDVAGFTVQETTAILHNPRLVAVAAVALTKKVKWPLLTAWVQRTLIAAQRLEHTRWCYFTGSFIAAKAVRK